MENFVVEIKTMNQSFFIGKTITGPYWELGELITQCFQWAQTNEKEVDGPMHILYYDNPKEVSPEACRAFVGFPVKKEAEASGGFEKKLEEEQTVASVIFKGAHHSKEKHNFYTLLYQWVKDNPQWEAQSPLTEIYVVFGPHLSEDELVTEICLPLKKV